MSQKNNGGAVGSMALCVALLIASEFMPVSLLTPIAHDLHATEGMVGQAISISGFFAVVTSLLIATIAGRFERRKVLITLSCVMLFSLVVIALAPNLLMLMVARALLGIVIGGFWALATATVMRLVPHDAVPKALGAIYMGNAVASAFAAPIGSYLGGLIGWRGVFLAMVPIVVVNIVWQWMSLPHMHPEAANPVSKLVGLLRRGNVAYAMLGTMLTFSGSFISFTYFRPFLERYTHVSLGELSLLLLALGLAGFAGTYLASVLIQDRLYVLLRVLPLLLALATVFLLIAGHSVWTVAAVLVLWGAIYSAVPVCWAAWLAKGIADEPESGGGLQIAVIQLSIMLGAGSGGILLDHISLEGPFVAGAVLLVLASLAVGNGSRLQPKPVQ